MEFEQLMQLIDKVSESKLTGFKYEDSDIKLDLVRKGAKMADAGEAPESPADAPKEAAQEQAGTVIFSPLVGTFYAAPSEEAQPYVQVGDTVTKGQVLGMVEAMKLMNEIESECDGIVMEVLAENAQTVEYGQPLFVIR